MKYIIAMYDRIRPDYIVGGSYIVQNEKYATLTEDLKDAKRYSSYNRASAALEKLLMNCVNITGKCKIEEVEE